MKSAGEAAPGGMRPILRAGARYPKQPIDHLVFEARALGRYTPLGSI
jgi:hypothetical protein